MTNDQAAEIARSNFHSAVDMCEEYSSLQAAFDAYDDNITDTVCEQGGTFDHVLHASGIYQDLIALYRENV